LFCDAVGFTLGGPCFLQAFSSYLGNLDSKDFYRVPEHLGGSTHPITWLRIKFLAARAEEAGYRELADEIREEWLRVSRALAVVEDYHGYYEDNLAQLIRRIIDDMLLVTAPREIASSEAAGHGWSPGVDSPLRLLNWAWQMYRADSGNYPIWEAQQISLLLEDLQQ
jgi:hypothetical protein